MTDGGVDREAIERYVDNHPDADRWEVLSQLGIDPSRQELVDELLDESSDDEPIPDAEPTDGLDEAPDPSTDEDRQLLAEARAVVDEDPDPPVKGIDDVDEVSAAAMMGGDSAFASDDDDQDTDPTTSSPQANYERAVSTLPLAQLDALSPADRRRAARKRGLEWPTTDEARDRLEETIHDVMRHEDDRIIDAPTSLGKSHTIAATRWGARDEAVETARDDGGEHFVLRSRHEACPVAAGDHDPDPEGQNENQTLSIDGGPISEWIQDMCDGRGLPFSAVHRHLEEHNDQGVELPCTHDGACPAIEQWDEWREGDHPLTIATHNFAHVPGLRTATNIVFDEEVDFAAELSTDRVRRAVRAYLREIADDYLWEHFGFGAERLEEYWDSRGPADTFEDCTTETIEAVSPNEVTAGVHVRRVDVDELFDEMPFVVEIEQHFPPEDGREGDTVALHGEHAILQLLSALADLSSDRFEEVPWDDA